MGEYRISRNCEASLIDFLVNKLEENHWTGISVVKAFQQVYDESLPVICINVGESEVFRREIGGRKFLENIEISIRFFCQNDGQRLDLKDFVIEQLQNDVDYFVYSIESGEAQQKRLA